MTTQEVKRVYTKTRFSTYWGQSGIYVITCIPSGKYYIGSSVDIGQRFTQHLSALRNNSHRNKYLQRAWNKYGFDNFKFDVLHPVYNQENLYSIEESWIKMKNTTSPDIGFNLTHQCTVPHNKDKKASKAAKLKMSQYWAGRPKGLKGRTLQPVVGTNKKTGEVIGFTSLQEAKRQGYGNILRAVKKGIRCKGFTWKLKEKVK